MALQYSVTLRNNQNNQVESTLGASAKLQLRSGAAPANCAAADSGTLICEITVPADFLTASSAGLVQKNGAWAGTAAAVGTVAHFRFKDNGLTTTHMQGTVTLTGSGGDLTLDDTAIGSIGQSVTITQFDITRNNA